MLEVSPGPTTHVEDGIRGLAFTRFQERFIVLANIVLSSAVPVIFGRPVIIPDGYFRNAPQLCFIERLGRLVRITIRLHCACRFSTRTVAFGARAIEEFSHSRAGPAPALAGGDTLGVVK